jgi:predicted phage-related endonuclease
LEPVICDLYAKKYGGKLERWPAYTLARDAARPFLHATPDAVVWEDGRAGPGSLSLKTWSEFDQAAWADEPPIYSQVQIQQELAVLGWQWGVIAVMFGSQRLERYYVERNDYFIQALYDACGRFWLYVTSKVEPPADESQATAAALYRLHPDDSGLAVELPDDADSLIIALDAAKDAAKAADLIKARCENQLKSWLGDETYGITPEGRVVSWKTQERKEYTVQASRCRVLRSVKALPRGVPIVGRVIDRQQPVAAIAAESEGSDERTPE